MVSTAIISFTMLFKDSRKSLLLYISTYGVQILCLIKRTLFVLNVYSPFPANEVKTDSRWVGKCLSFHWKLIPGQKWKKVVGFVFLFFLIYDSVDQLLVSCFYILLPRTCFLEEGHFVITQLLSYSGHKVANFHPESKESLYVFFPKWEHFFKRATQYGIENHLKNKSSKALGKTELKMII